MKKYSQFHDGSFEGFWIDGITVHVYLSTLEKERFTVVNEGVVAVAAGGFRAGNIVFDIVSRNHKEITLRDIEELYDLREGPAGESQDMRQLGKAQKEELTLFEISPSYGATCMVLAHSVDVLERNEWFARYSNKRQTRGG
jgi:hypothetical protein